VLTVLLVLCGLGLAWLTGLELLVLGRFLVQRWQHYRQRLRPFRVAARRDFTPDLFELVLEPLPSFNLPAFIPGQFLTLAGPLLPSGKPAERRYSLAAWQPHPQRYVLCIKREPKGRVSRWLHTQALAGTTLQCRLPRGEFVVEQHHLQAPAIVLVGGGVGITPVKAMLEWLRHRHYRGQVYLYQSARGEGDLLYYDEFQRQAATWSHFQYRPFLSREQPLRGEQQGRLSAATLFSGGGTDAHYFFCAAQLMTDELVAGLQGCGVPASRLHFELFAASGSGCGPFDVTVDQHTLNAEGYPTLLHVLEAMNLPVESDCRAGTCGRCQVKLEAGQLRNVISPESPLPDATWLACCAVPESPVRISL
jgi:ferredoxin-NADP reductase